MTKKITYNDIYINRIFPSGGYEVSAMVDGYRVARTYFDYTKREVINLFYKEVNGTK